MEILAEYPEALGSEQPQRPSTLLLKRMSGKASPLGILYYSYIMGLLGLSVGGVSGFTYIPSNNIRVALDTHRPLYIRFCGR